MDIGFIHPKGFEERYGFIKRDGSAYIGLDNASGGYPYESRDWQDMFTWPCVEKALDYKETFKDKDWVLVGVTGLALNFSINKEKQNG